MKNLTPFLLLPLTAFAGGGSAPKTFELVLILLVIASIAGAVMLIEYGVGKLVKFIRKRFIKYTL